MTILQTERLLLREFRPEDIDALALILCDPETMRYYPAAYDLAGVEQWIERNRKRYKADRVGLWAMLLKSSSCRAEIPVCSENSAVAGTRIGAPTPPLELIGDCGIILQEVEGERLFEIGYHLRRDLWGQGLATEAAVACRNWAFAHLKTDRLISIIRPENIPSRRVAERNGMTVWKEVNWRGLSHLIYSIDTSGQAVLKQNAPNNSSPTK